MSNKDIKKCHTVSMIHGECKNYWCYAYGICALCKQCDDCCQCAFLPCQECICDACNEQLNNNNEQITKLINERDEARRMYCSVVENSRPHGSSAEDVAKRIGWNCYKKEETQ